MSAPNDSQHYLNLITSEYKGQPNFEATISSMVDVLVQVQLLLESMIDIFDIDLSPVGNQLDIIGQWVGAPRTLNNPFSGIFFEWDGPAANGWDFGVWKDPRVSSIATLPDDIYLVFIKARIAINQWDGTTDGMYRIWEAVLPQYNLMIQDNQDMSFKAIIQGTVPDSLTKALIAGGYLVPKPEGIRITEYVFPVDTNPIFAWDCDSVGLKGWDEASWGDPVAPT